MKINKKTIIIYIIILCVSLIMCWDYVRMHWANDTYAIYDWGYYEYGTKIFLKNGRPFSCLLLIIAEIFNLKIEILVKISTILGICISSASVMLIRKIICNFKPPKNNLDEFKIIVISYCTIYNFMYIDILYFAEACILATGVFFSIFAAYKLVLSSKHKIIKSFFYLLIAVFCYNGIVGVYIVSVVLLLLLQNNTFSKNLKYILITVVLIITTIILNFIQIKLVSNLFNFSQNTRLSSNIIYNILFILKNARKNFNE